MALLHEATGSSVNVEAEKRRKEAKRTPEEMQCCGVLRNTLRDTGQGSSAHLEFSPLILQATVSWNTIHIKLHPEILLRSGRVFL